MSLKKTALFKKHQELKAKTAEFAGYEMPIQYSSVKEEVLAVRKKAGLFDVSHMGEFFVEGVDAEKFVDSLLCNDFLGAANEKAVYSPLCNEQGAIIDDLIAYKLEPGRVLICVNASNIEKDWNWISSQKEKFDAQVSNHSQEYSLLALQGPDSKKIMLQLAILPSGDFPYYSAKAMQKGNTELIIARTGYTGEDGFEIFGSHSTIVELWEQMVKVGVTPCGLASRDVLRIEVGYPLYGHELTEDWTPLDAGLKWTVKLDKGHFIGKAALENYQPRFRLVKLSLEKGIPREGYTVKSTEGAPLGRVVSGTLSVITGKGICLALIEKEKFPEDKKFLIAIRNKDYQANYHTKPFVQGGHK